MNNAKEAYKSMPMRELRKYYRTEMLKRRQLLSDYKAQIAFCKEVRSHMKQLAQQKKVS